MEGYPLELYQVTWQLTGSVLPLIKHNTIAWPGFAFYTSVT